jgi:hypothetical protein
MNVSVPQSGQQVVMFNFPNAGGVITRPTSELVAQAQP